MRHESSLRRTLLLWLLVPLSALLLTGAAVGYMFAHRLSEAVYDRELLEVATELSLHLTAADGRVRLDLSPAAERILLFDQDDRVTFRVADPEGRTIAGDAGLPPPDRPLSALAKPVYFRHDQDGEPRRVIAMGAQLPDAGDLGRVLIEVAETTVKRTALARDILFGIVTPQLLLIALAGVLVRFGVGHGLRPLERLRSALADRSHRDLTIIPLEGTPTEVRPLVDSINELMLRLDRVLAHQTRFIADAAHQLRTPVAGMKTSIEVALRENEPAQAKRALAQIYVGVERLSRLVAQLLSLARNDPESVQALNFSLVDLNKTIFAAAMEWVPEAYKKNIDLGFEGPDRPVLIEGDPLRLVELANNLIDNAIRYTRDGGRVTVRVADAPRPILSVSDDGPTIPPEERERIFERFHRLLGNKADGSGLGLAIVREIARIHGAEVILSDDTDGEGNRFAVMFTPVNQAAAGSA